jgi:polar amino acid transport system substrate-binding protein
MTNRGCRWIGAMLAAAWALTCGFATPSAIAGPLRLVTDQWIPYENLSDADAPGFSTEVLKAVFASMKQEVSFEEFPWARAARLVFRGERDALFTAFYDEERARFCHFPKEPLARDKWIFFVRAADAGRLKFSSFADLVGHEIAVLRGASTPPSSGRSRASIAPFERRRATRSTCVCSKPAGSTTWWRASSTACA